MRRDAGPRPSKPARAAGAAPIRLPVCRLVLGDKGPEHTLADAGDFERITRRINGGLNGQDDRLALWKNAGEVLG
jgi:predicted chitinase